MKDRIFFVAEDRYNDKLKLLKLDILAKQEMVGQSTIRYTLSDNSIISINTKSLLNYTTEEVYYLSLEELLLYTAKDNIDMMDKAEFTTILSDIRKIIYNNPDLHCYTSHDVKLEYDTNPTENPNYDSLGFDSDGN